MKVGHLSGNEPIRQHMILFIVTVEPKQHA